ncbi:hypothetical protein [Rhizobium rhizogenes]|uniref:hypothetical protein n=1 Tax=Rhizobium rhizogenes TaxID=359 RepID=UPI001F2534A8|nr:hypothetical protein [Rhizobium rhizogenes]
MTQGDDKVSGFEGKNLGSHPKDEADRKKVMSPTLTAKILMRDAWPLRRYSKLDNVFYEAVRFISPRVTKSFTARRARSIWEGTARRIDSDEMDALRAALIEESKIEARELRAHLASLDQKIASFEAAAHRQAMARQGQEMGRSGRMDHG